MMKAAVFRDIGKMEIVTIPKPVCPPGGILIKVVYCGICGGDVRNFHSGLRDGVRNQIIGHEIAGEVAEVAPGVARFQPGDRVALAPDVSCGECWYCKRGLVNLCQSHKMLGTHYPGGYAQFLALPAEVLLRGFVERVPEGMDMRHAAFAETCAAVVACQRENAVSLGETVVVIGDGPVGCLHCEVARARGARVILAGRGKIELARRFEPHHLIDNADPARASREILEITGGIGADAVILAVPNVQAQRQALDIVRKRGRVIIYGGAPKGMEIAELDSNRIHYGEISIVGSFSYPATGLSDAIDALSAGVIDADKYLMEIVPLEDVVEAMRRMRGGKALKILIDPWKGEKIP